MNIEINLISIIQISQSAIKYKNMHFMNKYKIEENNDKMLKTILKI
jgi:hypothetical protein